MMSSSCRATRSRLQAPVVDGRIMHMCTEVGAVHHGGEQAGVHAHELVVHMKHCHTQFTKLLSTRWASVCSEGTYCMLSSSIAIAIDVYRDIIAMIYPWMVHMCAWQ